MCGNDFEKLKCYGELPRSDVDIFKNDLKEPSVNM